jgi:hypothetical protein
MTVRAPLDSSQHAEYAVLLLQNMRRPETAVKKLDMPEGRIRDGELERLEQP